MPGLVGIVRCEERERTERRHVSRGEVRHWPGGDKYDKAALCAIGPGQKQRRLLTWLCARISWSQGMGPREGPEAEISSSSLGHRYAVGTGQAWSLS
eukprot:superscaffoldBa00007922_g22936